MMACRRVGPKFCSICHPFLGSTLPALARHRSFWLKILLYSHSCANIVWTQQILVNWSVLLKLLADAGCSEDDIRQVKYLLSWRLNWGLPYQGSSRYAFQGDSLSGNLFTLYLADALYHLRAFLSYLRPYPPFAENLLPLEWEWQTTQTSQMRIRRTWSPCYQYKYTRRYWRRGIFLSTKQKQSSHISIWPRRQRS